MNNISQSRVHYFERQFLRRQDFADEQSYQIALRRRHNITHHSWGIVVGLELAQENETLLVRPGLAIDGYGRELLLSSKAAIDSLEFARLGSNRLDVWIRYEASEGSKARPGVVSCDDPRSGNFYRTDETPRIDLVRASPSRITRPKGVPDALLSLPVQLETSDDADDVWGVYLGRVTFVPEAPDSQKQFLIDSADRHYADVLAEVIDHPSHAHRIQLGPRANGEEREIGETKYIYRTESETGFAIFVPRPVTETIATLDSRFSINPDGKNLLRGDTSIYGNLQMAGGSVQFPFPGVVDQDVVHEHPCIYRASEGRKSTATDSDDQPPPEAADELRIDLGTPVGTRNRKFVVGFTTEDGSFRPALTIEYRSPAPGHDPQPLVTIEGDLKLNGLVNCRQLIESALTKETLDALLASFQAGSIAAGGQ